MYKMISFPNLFLCDLYVVWICVGHTPLDLKYKFSSNSDGSKYKF